MLNKLCFSVVNTVSSKLRIHNQIYTPNPLCNIKFVYPCIESYFFFALYEQCFIHIYVCVYIYFFNFQRNLHIDGKDWTTI
uniref:Macaca fascicularis brain cDNA, clone: QtrA-17492 n=1 Tax=Macaca fascicularis TaxID=9541 RepID=I7G4N9_MACFA|nr:unnamed protein product [Macaca fascicularis]